MGLFILVIICILSFLTGCLVKFVDFIEDDLKQIKKNVFLKKLSLPLGILYGLLIAFILILHPILFPLAAGTIFGEVVAKKIDRKSHFVAIFIFILFSVVLAIFGVINNILNFYFVALLIIFLAASLLDEVADKYSEKFSRKNIFFHVLSFRPFLEVTSFMVSLISSEWVIWITIFSFDLAYITSTKIFPKLFSKRV